MSRKYRHYADGEYIYFITSIVVQWIPLFLSHRYFTVLTDAFTYCRGNKGLLIHAYVLMPNHFHIIASSNHDPLSRASFAISNAIHRVS